jgi:hypothetical protein
VADAGRRAARPLPGPSGSGAALFATILALASLTGGAPAWLAAVPFAAHVPWNLVLLVDVWRGPDAAFLARPAIAAWAAALSVP